VRGSLNGLRKFCIAGIVLLTGCSTSDPRYRRAEIGAEYGAAAGAGAGSLLTRNPASSPGNIVAGTAAGALVGAVAGSMLGTQQDSYCPACGTVYADGSQVCPYDGTPLKPRR
jgi:hypothetical protein